MFFVLLGLFLERKKHYRNDVNFISNKETTRISKDDFKSDFSLHIKAEILAIDKKNS